MDRIQQGAGATIQVTVQVDGVATDPSPATATIGITRDDGTVLVAAGTGTTRTGVGVFTYALTPTHTATLDVLTAAWTFTLGGNSTTLRTTVEVVGGFLFTIADARAVTALADAAEYTTAQIVSGRTLAEEALEDACGVAFVPRYKRELVDGSGTAFLPLPKPRIRTVRAVSLDGVAETDLTVFATRATGQVYSSSGFWAPGFGNYEIAYEHGYSYPPARVSKAALMLAKHFLVEGPIDDRATAQTNEFGTFSILTPGVRGVLFGLPEVEAVVSEYGYRVSII